MLPAADRQAMQDMVDHAQEGVALAQGRTRADLDGDRHFQLVSRSLIAVVGEAARRVSRETRAGAPEIPWRQIVGSRDRVVHRYDEVDSDVVWQILTVDFPALVQELERLLAQG